MPRPNVESERRQQVIEAAMTCFSRKGYYSSSMDDIASELSFSKALIYYYFKTKRDIFLAILEDWVQETTNAWEMMFSSENDITMQLRRGLEYGIQLVIESKDLARIEFEFYAEIGRDEEVRRAIQNVFANFRAEFKRLLDAGIANGDFRPFNTEVLSAVLFGTYEGLALQANVAPDMLDWSAVTESLFDMTMQGISSSKE
jgi:AcrR family transcriptional regulator